MKKKVGPAKKAKKVRKVAGGESRVASVFQVRKRCVACGSGNVRPMRGRIGSAWWQCLNCNEEF